MSWLKVMTTAELRTTWWSPSATLALTVSGAVSARSTSPAATNTRTIGNTHQRRRSAAPSPLSRATVGRIWEPQARHPHGRTGYFRHTPDSTATAIRLIERAGSRFSRQARPLRLGLRHHEPRQQ